VVSGTEWQWDLYSGRHDELMNGNASKVETSGDAWNGEDFSVIDTDSSGAVQLRQDVRVLDRIHHADLEPGPLQPAEHGRAGRLGSVRRAGLALDRFGGADRAASARRVHARGYDSRVRPGHGDGLARVRCDRPGD